MEDMTTALGADLLPLIGADSKTDKHSLNLWKWVRKHKDSRLFVAISVNEKGQYDPGKTQTGGLYVGMHDLDQGWLHGAGLASILGNGNAHSFAFPPKMHFKTVPNWWQGYIDKGKCFIDPEHVLYLDAERWDVTDNGQERACLWCGQHKQYLHTEMVPRTHWSNAAQEETP